MHCMFTSEIGLYRTDMTLERGENGREEVSLQRDYTNTAAKREQTVANQ